ncbi:MAG: ABC transporter ATP-binding protein [Candidatus Dormibacteraeota bacterium]|nr:ABC transporter ATP-binding protein [Candidatus Dormibacteraeota bacterium]
MSAAPVLQVLDLGVTVNGVPAVRGVSFTLDSGRRTGLIGESGSGKSLTALAVMGLLPDGLQASGSVLFDDPPVDLLRLPEKDLVRLRGDRLAMVFQEPMTALNPVMRVGEQVAEPLRLHAGLGRGAARAQARALLERVQVPEPAARMRAYPHQLSGGQRQRVMIAIATACRPRLLIADEPTTALDVTVQAQVLALLSRLVDEDGSTLLLIAHDLAVVSQVCDEVLVMYGGRLVETGPAVGVLAEPRHPYTDGLLAAIPPLDRDLPGRRLPAIPGNVPGLGQFPDGCPFRNRCLRADARCAEMPPLEGSPHAVACWHPVG